LAKAACDALGIGSESLGQCVALKHTRGIRMRRGKLRILVERRLAPDGGQHGLSECGECLRKVLRPARR
jgi:hypothetical protein